MKPALHRKNPAVDRRLYGLFALLVVFLLVTVGLILRKEMNPEWMRYQREFFRAETKKATKALADADEAQRPDLQKRLRYLNRPRFRIRQIVLEDGKRVDRCITCHLDLKELAQKHSQRVRTKLREVQKSGLKIDELRCLGCHTTGFNEVTGHYLENRVTCEGCHGPGGFYAELMAGGRARDGAELARANILETRADRVCLNCHKPDRHGDYEGEDLPPTLTAAYLDGIPVPEVDGQVREDAWRMALETKVETWQLSDGPPQPGPEVFMRAVYDNTDIYFALRWSDKTRHNRMGRWIFSDGQWQAQVNWPDALALHWQITEQVADFGQGGCAVLCHSTGSFEEFPRMAARQEGAIVDEWYWNAFAAARAGRPGDGFLDHQVKFVPQSSLTPAFRGTHPEISAAHGSDTSGKRMPETVGGIPLILNAGEIEGKPPHPRFYMEGGKRIPLQLSDSADPVHKSIPLYGSGLPGGGDSADIRGRASWSDGYWTLELTRAL